MAQSRLQALTREGRRGDDETSGLVPIYTGLKAGERVVTVGSFLLSAESLKLNPSQGTRVDRPSIGQPAPEVSHPVREPAEPAAQNVKVMLTKDGYRPASITVRKNILVRLTLVRQVEVTCGTEIAIPEYNIKRDLPLNEPVVIEFTPNKAGEIGFGCGMNMLRGKIVVK